jgi:hypothetical protein
MAVAHHLRFFLFPLFFFSLLPHELLKPTLKIYLKNDCSMGKQAGDVPPFWHLGHILGGPGDDVLLSSPPRFASPRNLLLGVRKNVAIFFFFSFLILVQCFRKKINLSFGIPWVLLGYL